MIWSLGYNKKNNYAYAALSYYKPYFYLLTIYIKTIFS